MTALASTDERVAAIKHEVLHLLLDHAGRSVREEREPRLYDLATDLVINQLIGRWPLPPGAITLDSFEFDLPKGQSADWYYDVLVDHEDDIPEDTRPGHSDHEEWGEGEGPSQDVGDNELSRLVEQAQARSGDRFDETDKMVAALVQTLIERLRPTIDWRRVLRMFTSSSRRTRVSNTLRRPSKRYGTYPGIKVKRFHRLAAIIDTSGSVSDDQLAAFFAEIHAMWRQGSEVIVVEADAQVQRTWTYQGHVLPSTGGRGGTRFDPALQWVSNAVPGFDAAIYLTDGKARAPSVRPRCKLLWVLPPDGEDKALAGQRVVRINR